METLAASVYLLCFVTSFACLVLLARSYLRTRLRLLLWTAICFVFFAINNGLVFLDIVVLPEVDLSVARDIANLLAVSTLLYGFVWDTD
jgi:hypothetical protein